MSRSGSRYPSAYGHTPSYRSYSSGPASASLALADSFPSTDFGASSALSSASAFSKPLQTYGGNGIQSSHSSCQGAT